MAELICCAKNSTEYCRTTLSVINAIQANLSSGALVSNTYTKLVKVCNKPAMHGVLNPRNHGQVKILIHLLGYYLCLYT